MANLLGLYQQDAQARDPELSQPVTNTATWIAAARHDLGRLRERYDRSDEVSFKQKKMAATCLDLATQSLQVGASLNSDIVAPAGEPPEPDTDPDSRRFLTVFTAMFVLLLLNLWFMSPIGVFSLFTLIVVLVFLHWTEIGRLERRLRSGRSRRTPAARTSPAANPRTITVGTHVEAVVRRTDEIIGLAGAPDEAPPQPSLKVETLEFLQDILEAKVAGDAEYAFKKISRTLTQVLSSEGIEVVTDAQDHAPMFHIDTVADAAKAGTMEIIRPALVKNSHCIMTGYAQRFVDA